MILDVQVPAISGGGLTDIAGESANRELRIERMVSCSHPHCFGCRQNSHMRKNVAKNGGEQRSFSTVL